MRALTTALALTFFLPLLANATLTEEGVYRFPVKKYSHGIACLQLNLTSKGDDTFTAELTASKYVRAGRNAPVEIRTQVASFNCFPHQEDAEDSHTHSSAAHVEKTACASDHGDFLIYGRERPVIKFVYLNLQPIEVDVDITIEFEIAHDNDNSYGHSHSAIIRGYPGACPELRQLQ